MTRRCGARRPLHRSPTSRHDAHRPRGAGRFVHRSNRTRMADGIAHIVRGACSNHRSARASSHFLAPSRAFSLHPAPRRHDASASITASPPTTRAAQSRRSLQRPARLDRRLRPSQPHRAPRDPPGPSLPTVVRADHRLGRRLRLARVHFVHPRALRRQRRVAVQQMPAARLRLHRRAHRQPHPQRVRRQLRRLQRDHHRQALHHLDPVPRRVLRRQHRERAARARREALHPAVIRHPRAVQVRFEPHRLAHPHVPQLPFLEVRLHPHLPQLHHRHQRHPRPHLLPDLHRPLPDRPVHRRHDRRALQVPVRQLELRGRLLHRRVLPDRPLAAQRARRLPLRLRSRQRRLRVRQRRLRPRQLLRRHHLHRRPRPRPIRLLRELQVRLARLHRLLVRLHRQPRVRHLPHRLRELRLRLRERRRRLRVVEPHQRLPRLHLLRVGHQHVGHRPLDLRGDLHDVARHVRIVRLFAEAAHDEPVERRAQRDDRQHSEEPCEAAAARGPARGKRRGGFGRRRQAVPARGRAVGNGRIGGRLRVRSVGGGVVQDGGVRDVGGAGRRGSDGPGRRRGAARGASMLGGGLGLGRISRIHGEGGVGVDVFALAALTRCARARVVPAAHGRRGRGVGARRAAIAAASGGVAIAAPARPLLSIRAALPAALPCLGHRSIIRRSRGRRARAPDASARSLPSFAHSSSRIRSRLPRASHRSIRLRIVRRHRPRRRRERLARLRGRRAARRPRVEAAAQRADQPHPQRAPPRLQLHHVRALVQQRELRHVDVLAHPHPPAMPVLRQRHHPLRRAQRLLLRLQQRVERRQRRQLPRHLAQRRIHRLVVQRERHVRVRHVAAQLRLQPAAIEDRQRQRRPDRAAQRIVPEQRRRREREQPAQRRQVHVRVERRARAVDRRVHRLHPQSRRDDVRPPPQQPGRQPRGQRRVRERRELRPRERQPALRPPSAQHAQLQLLQLDLLVGQRDLLEQLAALERRVVRVVAVVDPARRALAQHRLDLLARAALLLQQLAQRIRAVQLAVQRHDRHRQREPRLLGLHARRIAHRQQPARGRRVLAPQVQLIVQPDEQRRRRHHRFAHERHRHRQAVQRRIEGAARARHVRLGERGARRRGEPRQRFELLQLRLRDADARLRGLQRRVLPQRFVDERVELRIAELAHPVRARPCAVRRAAGGVRERVVAGRARRERRLQARRHAAGERPGERERREPARGAADRQGRRACGCVRCGLRHACDASFVRARFLCGRRRRCRTASPVTASGIARPPRLAADTGASLCAVGFVGVVFLFTVIIGACRCVTRIDTAAGMPCAPGRAVVPSPRSSRRADAGVRAPRLTTAAALRASPPRVPCGGPRAPPRTTPGARTPRRARPARSRAASRPSPARTAPPGPPARSSADSAPAPPETATRTAAPTASRCARRSIGAATHGASPSARTAPPCAGAARRSGASAPATAPRTAARCAPARAGSTRCRHGR
ncbi:hypothetical protein BURPS1710b_A2099 [Burkholderia pseudomallei 1710b]|uniref:Uncharacterized protein n=1 Tax=Burkholderia pseudomallei (strain 1710b) TaxID=320372 RepID=Q3JGQ4_BURP1|nr:hypothetical protein BURPS1710b_A2099 [Burkholderia pseudomallei 1710b]